MSNDQTRFNRILGAVFSKPPLAVGKPVKEAPASSEGSSEGYDGTRTPKGKSGAASYKRECMCR